MAKKHEHLMIDRLMRAGVSFHPNTVVVDASQFTQEKETGRLRNDVLNRPIGEVCYPQFDYMFIEFMPNGNGVVGNHYGVYVMKESINHFSMIVFMSNVYNVSEYDQRARGFNKWKERGFIISHYDGLIEADYNNKGQLASIDTRNVIMNDDDLRCHINGVNIFWSYHEINQHGGMEGIFDETDAPIVYFCNPALHALAQLHKKAEIELVDYPPQSLRRIARETGKEPSPFFMLKHQPINQKRYKYTNPPVKQDKLKEVILSQLPLTWIKGHFMTHPPTHPIPHFAGKTFFVEAHTRGDKKFGEVKKGYYIRQPKQKEIAPMPEVKISMERAKQDFDKFVRQTGNMTQKWGEKV